jgi:hypothetical protein
MRTTIAGMRARPAWPRRGLRRVLREAGLYASILLCTLFAIEVMLRAADLRELRDGYGVGYSLVHRHDPVLGWRPISNTVTTFRGSRTITVHHNSLGLRDVEHDGRTGPTVVFLGDSFVWGYDVEEGERFTERLRDELPGVHIVNAGISGYGTDQEYLLLERIWATIKPHVVVLMFCTGNDREDNTANVRYGGYYKPYLARTADGGWQFAGQPVPKSRHVYFTDNPLVKHVWLARAAMTAYVYWRYPEIDVPDPTEHLISMRRGFVQSRGAKFLTALQFHEPRLETFLDAQAIPHVAFDGAESTMMDGNHWTPRGHALVAQRLRSFLEANGVDGAAKPERQRVSDSGAT